MVQLKSKWTNQLNYSSRDRPGRWLTVICSSALITVKRVVRNRLSLAPICMGLLLLVLPKSWHTQGRPFWRIYPYPDWVSDSTRWTSISLSLWWGSISTSMLDSARREMISLTGSSVLMEDNLFFWKVYSIRIAVLPGVGQGCSSDSYPLWRTHDISLPAES